MQSGLTFEYSKSVGGLNSTSALDVLSLPRHRWYFIKEAFSPNLVSQAIKDSKCNKNDLIIDVFCGGGTVPVTAALEGYSTIGFEVNPFLAFIAKTKLLQCNPRRLIDI
jgi:DNA modification methylase